MFQTGPIDIRFTTQAGGVTSITSLGVESRCLNLLIAERLIRQQPTPAASG